MAAGATPPVSWDVASGRNVAWTTPIPGLGHSSPVVWGDRVLLTTAVPLARDGAAIDDRVDLQDGRSVPAGAPHAWRLYCLDRATGRIVWERTAHEGVPRVKRHSKASYASAKSVSMRTRKTAMPGMIEKYARKIGTS